MSNKFYSLSEKSWVENQNEEEVFNDSLYTNSAIRIPVVFCIDTGRCMYKLSSDGTKTKIAKVQETIENYIKSFNSDSLKHSVDYSIVTFSDDTNCEKNFSTANDFDFKFDLESESYSNIGNGVNLAVNLLENRINEYKEVGREYTNPFLFIFFGSNADLDDASIKNASERVSILTDTEGLNVFPINIEDANMEILGQFFSESTFQKFGDIDLENIFNSFSKSDIAISNSKPSVSAIKNEKFENLEESNFVEDEVQFSEDFAESVEDDVQSIQENSENNPLHMEETYQNSFIEEDNQLSDNVESF